MPFPSLWNSAEQVQTWSLARAAAYGAAIGALAAGLKTLSALHGVAGLTGPAAKNAILNVPEIAAATIAFAVLCAGAAALRNFIARRLIWPQ